MQKYLSKPKKRKRSSQINQQTHPTLGERRSAKNKSVVMVSVILVALFGAGIAFFVMGTNIPWILGGAIFGGIIGFVFGEQIVKGLSKK